ncbi:hypothetical protein [uncultured Kriegella sp.]|uniref:hypothetical protein n=1 Tax=uncultured Kriegella sp. TaxID=1798910 RepID=UPI0030D85881|tara:strand:- start:13661 stop:14095 length:435 start_codon:yes stop_codon:yes gene_type:complete
MKTIKSLLGTLLILALFMTTAGVAQEGHYYTVTTWKIQIPQDGSRAELNDLMKEFSEKVVLKNEKILSEKVMHHISGADLRDLVITTEYANWNDIDAASTRQAELMETAWPSEDERKNFLKTWNKYVITHSDEIYQEMPELAKK